MTAQRFDLFDAVTDNIAPYGYPEIDFAEAKAEGDYIRVLRAELRMEQHGVSVLSLLLG